MIDYYDLAENTSLEVLLTEYPLVADFLANLNLDSLNRKLPLAEALEAGDQGWLEELGTDVDQILEDCAEFLETFYETGMTMRNLESVTIIGGTDKNGQSEETGVTVRRGEVLSIVGPTGSGKSRLLADIECLAQGDTPTGRRILLDGNAPDEETRFELEGRLVAQLSQNMNFVMDLSVEEFLLTHAGSRMSEDPEDIVERCLSCANELSGESFSAGMKVTQLSGGQSRALMIADAALMSDSPVVLIDEIENAGIDRRQALSILTGSDKIVFLSTHDPLLALSAHRRVVIRGGGMRRIIEASKEEKESLRYIEQLDAELLAVRDRLRRGEQIIVPGGMETDGMVFPFCREERSQS